jgi:GntR family transcriptional regulator, transcriptional repressor for pyruvate dehydrogenase complex
MGDQASPSTVFGVFERNMLPDRIAERLISLIADRQLKPGDKLPSERDLAAMMQVSRPALREALRGLAMIGIVEIRQGSGTYVASLKPELLVEHLDFVFTLDDSTFTELLEARAMLEPSIAAAAALNATEAELAEIGVCLERAAASVHDVSLFLAADLELHQKITAAAHNQMIGRFMATLSRLGSASRSRTGELQTVRNQSLQDLQEIIAALQRRDPQAASRAMQNHLINIHKRFNENTNNEASR